MVEKKATVRKTAIEEGAVTSINVVLDKCEKRIKVAFENKIKELEQYAKEKYKYEWLEEAPRSCGCEGLTVLNVIIRSSKSYFATTIN